MRVTAAVVNKYNTPFEIESLELDDPIEGEVQIRIVATGICHTDGLAQQADLPFPVPGVLGHEGSGVVEKLGAGVKDVKVGDHVIIGWPFCGACANCSLGQPRYCASLGALLAGGQRADGSKSLSRDGEEIHSHFFGQSSFSTFVNATASSLVVVDKELPLHKLGPLACGISTGAGAVFNTLKPGLGSTIVVYGTGAVGLAAIMAAKNTGAARIVGVDVVESRLDLAIKFGATDIINASKVDPVEELERLLRGKADYSIECTGVISVVRQAIDSVGMLGTCCLIGGAPAGAEFKADHISTLWGKRIVGILGGETTSNQLIKGLLALHSQGRFPFDELIQEFDLSQINEALEASYSGAVLKPVLRMP